MGTTPGQYGDKWGIGGDKEIVGSWELRVGRELLIIRIQIDRQCVNGLHLSRCYCQQIYMKNLVQFIKIALINKYQSD